MNRISSVIAVALVGLAIVTPSLRAADLVVANVDSLNCGNTDIPGFLAGGFTVTGFAFDSTHAAQLSSASPGTNAQFGDFTVTKSIDACSPLFFQKMANSGHIPKVTFSWIGGIGSNFQITYLTIILEDTVITAWNYDGGQEKVAFSWSKITIKFTSTPKADGSGGGTIQTSWDRTSGKQ